MFNVTNHTEDIKQPIFKIENCKQLIFDELNENKTTIQTIIDTHKLTIFREIEGLYTEQQNKLDEKIKLYENKICELASRIIELEDEKRNWNKVSYTKLLDKQLTEKKNLVEILESKNEYLTRENDKLKKNQNDNTLIDNIKKENVELKNKTDTQQKVIENLKNKLTEIKRENETLQQKINTISIFNENNNDTITQINEVQMEVKEKEIELKENQEKQPESELPITVTGDTQQETTEELEPNTVYKDNDSQLLTPEDNETQTVEVLNEDEEEVEETENENKEEVEETENKEEVEDGEDEEEVEDNKEEVEPEYLYEVYERNNKKTNEIIKYYKIKNILYEINKDLTKGKKMGEIRKQKDGTEKALFIKKK